MWVGRWGNHPAAGQYLAPIVEHDHAVAKQAPPLLRVKGDDAGGVAVRALSRGAGGPVWTHYAPLIWAPMNRSGVPRFFRAGPAKTVRAGTAVDVTRRCPRGWNLPQPTPGTMVRRADKALAPPKHGARRDQAGPSGGGAAGTGSARQRPRGGPSPVVAADVSGGVWRPEAGTCFLAAVTLAAITSGVYRLTLG